MVKGKGRVEAIWIKRAHREPMVGVTSVRARAGVGLEGNADQGGRRQVTLIEREAFERLAQELGRPVDPSLRRANLMLSGISLQESRGRILEIGEVRLEILGETRPCQRMDEALPGLRRMLEPEWRAGAYGVVLNDCEIRIRDSVTWST